MNTFDKLAIGKIVLVYHRPSCSRRAAIVTRVIERHKGRINAHVFPEPDDPQAVETTKYGIAEYIHSEGDNFGTWRWPYDTRYNETGAQRGTIDQPPWHLLPFQAINAIARVLDAGRRKYGDRNWEKGLPVSQYIDHTMIHLAKFILSQTTRARIFDQCVIEKEDHLAHAATNLLMALETRARVMDEILPDHLLELSGTNLKKDEGPNR